MQVTKQTAKMESYKSGGLGFSSFLGLTHEFFETLSTPDQLDFRNHCLAFDLPVTKKLLLPRRNSVSLSTYMAILDDTTTWALVLDDEKRARAGVSVSLNTSWGPAPHTRPGETVQIAATVQKVGRNVGFVRASVKDAQGRLVCHGSHIKYMPIGMAMDFLQSARGQVVRGLISTLLPRVSNDEAVKELASLFDTFHMESDTRATVQVSSAHSSLGGPIHGGCQAVLMELAAIESLKRHQLDATLYSISLEYMGPPSSKHAELAIEILDYAEGQLIPVRVELQNQGILKSLGMLHFVNNGDTGVRAVYK
jgi:acyl-coenzyme A thioesterase PaaI-like protein